MTDEARREEDTTTPTTPADAGDVAELRKRLDVVDAERKELIAARDKAKEKARQEEEKRLEEQGEFKTIAEQRAAEAADLQNKIDAMDETLAKYRARDEKELTSLIDKVPENLRETINDAEIPLAKRLELARGLASARGTLPDPRLPGDSGGVNQITRKQFDALSPVKKSNFVLNGGRVTD